MVREVQTLEEFHDLINKSKYTIVDFTATWCPPVCIFLNYLSYLIAKYFYNIFFFILVQND